MQCIMMFTSADANCCGSYNKCRSVSQLICCWLCFVKYTITYIFLLFIYNLIAILLIWRKLHSFGPVSQAIVWCGVFSLSWTLTTPTLDSTVSLSIQLQDTQTLQHGQDLILPYDHLSRRPNWNFNNNNNNEKIVKNLNVLLFTGVKLSGKFSTSDL